MVGHGLLLVPVLAVLALLASVSADCPTKKFPTNASGTQV